ncbi:MAG: helix-turn-helix domain-containing protein [Methanomassiliicoccales archaeon]|nr:helix-turn-helix domain-containing protein [Methanomassiliicoccales archaeon]
MDGILDLENRRRIFDIIRSRPGTFMREIERESGLQVGVLTYHLRLLTEAGLVHKEDEGNHERYFPSDGFVLTDRRMISHLRNRSTRALLMYVLDKGMISFKNLQSALGISKSTLSYHLKRLSAAGMVLIVKDAGMTVTIADPKKMADMLIWVAEDVERDSADALIDVWNRLRDR